MRVPVIIASTAFILSIISCSEEGVLESPRQPTLFGSILPLPSSPVYSQFEVHQSRLSVHGSTITSISAEGLGWDEDSSLYLGTVKVNGTPIPVNVESDGYTWYSSVPRIGAIVSVPVTFGSYQVFEATGNTDYPSFKDSLLAPSADLTVLFPTPSDTISKSAGVIVTWNGTGADKARMFVSDASSSGFAVDVADNGSYTISSSKLSGLAPGPLTLTVVRGNYAYGDHRNGKGYLMVVYSLHEVHLNMTN